MVRSRLASWWIVWIMPIVGVILGAIAACYNVNPGDSSSVLMPVRDCLPVLLVLYLASLPGWVPLIAWGFGPGMAFPWLPFLVGQVVGFALLGLFMHWGGLASRFLVRRWRNYMDS
jgi:hypothetical protein